MSNSVTVPLSLAVEIFAMLKDGNEIDRFIALSRGKAHVRIANGSRSDAFARALAQYRIPDSVSVEDLIRFIEGLVSTDQAARFNEDATAVLVVPEITYTALKQFIDQRDIKHPLARSIAATAPTNCPDFRCPHSLSRT
jgi:hypothetical protein